MTHISTMPARFPSVSVMNYDDLLAELTDKDSTWAFLQKPCGNEIIPQQCKHRVTGALIEITLLKKEVLKWGALEVPVQKIDAEEICQMIEKHKKDIKEKHNMSTGQLGLLKKLAEDQGFSTEGSVNSEAAQFENPKENKEMLSLEKEKEKDDDDNDNDDDDDDDYDVSEYDYSDEDESSYESDTLDKTENTDDNLSLKSQSSSQISLKLIPQNKAASTSLGPQNKEEMDESQEEQNSESNNKTRKSVSFDGICKSKKITSTEDNSSASVFPKIILSDSSAVQKDVLLERKKMKRQENITAGSDKESIASVSVSQAASSMTSSSQTVGSSELNNELSSEQSQRNPSMGSSCQESTSILDNSSSKFSAIKKRQQRQNGWNVPVSIDERLDQNYQELYQLMTRDVEVKGKARQLIHAYQMEQLYEKYLSVSYDKIPPITLYPHNWPQCVISRLFFPAMSSLHSAFTNYSISSLAKPTYVIPRSALSVKNDSSLKKLKKESKETRSLLKLNNPMSIKDNQKNRKSSNNAPQGNLTSAQFVDHRLGHSANPDILKWLSGKNQIYWKQKKEEKVQKKLEKETKRLEMLMKAERRLQSQQAVYKWMQQKLKESRQSSLEEKEEKKFQMKKSTETYLCQDAFSEDKIPKIKNDSQICLSKLSDNQSKLNGHLKPVQGQIKTTKERKISSVKNPHFKHMESSYDAWTRQTVNNGLAKTSDDRKDFRSSITSKKKDEENHCSGNNDKYLQKEKENISLQENEMKSKANEEKLRIQTIRPKTARGNRVKHSDNSSFPDTTGHFDQIRNHSKEEQQDETRLDDESRLQEDNEDINNSYNGGTRDNE